MHDVTLTRGFLASKYEVTQGDWESLMGNNPSLFHKCGKTCPVERINWFEAVTFLNRMSERDGLEACYTLEGCSGGVGDGCGEGKATCVGSYTCQEVSFKGLACEGYRLPSESEWEYMARATTLTDTPNGDITSGSRNDDASLDGIAWYGGNSVVEYGDGWACEDWVSRRELGPYCGTHPVGRKYANSWGLHDVIGNVAEWTWDWYSGYSVAATTDPLGPPGGRWRTVRGCGWNFAAVSCRSAFRYRMDPARRFFFIGFRAVRTVAGPS